MLVDAGVVVKPVIWFGEDANRALWAIIVSIVWKVIGFGMLLFVAAIQAIPHDIDEAAMVDGATYWRRVWFITLPLTVKTILLVTHDIDEAVVMADRIVVMTQRPASVLLIEEVALPRPRLREDPEVGKLARRLSMLLE